MNIQILDKMSKLKYFGKYSKLIQEFYGNKEQAPQLQSKPIHSGELGSKTHNKAKSEELKRLAEWHDDPEFYKFKFYMSSERGKLYESFKVNQGIDEVPTLLEELKREYGFSYEIIDTSKMSFEEVKVVYKLCAHWAMTGSKGRKIYEIFRSYDYSGWDAGYFFGGGTPALLVYFLGTIDLVLPHEVGRWPKEETITIHDFLTALKEHLKVKSSGRSEKSIK